MTPNAAAVSTLWQCQWVVPEFGFSSVQSKSIQGESCRYGQGLLRKSCPYWHFPPRTSRTLLHRVVAIALLANLAGLPIAQAAPSAPPSVVGSNAASPTPTDDRSAQPVLASSRRQAWPLRPTRRRPPTSPASATASGGVTASPPTSSSAGSHRPTPNQQPSREPSGGGVTPFVTGTIINNGTIQLGINPLTGSFSSSIDDLTVDGPSPTLALVCTYNANDTRASHSVRVGPTVITPTWPVRATPAATSFSSHRLDGAISSPTTRTPHIRRPPRSTQPL